MSLLATIIGQVYTTKREFFSHWILNSFREPLVTPKIETPLLHFMACHCCGLLDRTLNFSSLPARISSYDIMNPALKKKISVSVGAEFL